MNAPRYTPAEERLNASSHAIGIVGGLAAGLWLIACSATHADCYMTVGLVLYLLGMMGSYVTSTLYHAWPAASPRKWALRKWDHAAIYWHIAGSYSPLTLAVMWKHSDWGLVLFVFVWLCAALGTFMSFARLKPKSHAETVCFVAMGLSILVAMKPLIDSASLTAFLWIVGEGACFITGAVLYALRLRYMHAVFHVCCLGGSACHIMAVWTALQYQFILSQ